MVGGFNHNFRYLGELYHIQTEDSGAKNSRIVTLLFRGGTILASDRTSYADLGEREDLAELVEDRMKEQHKEMMRRLKDGEFDAVINRLFAIPMSGGADLDAGPMTAALTSEETSAPGNDTLAKDAPIPTAEELELLVFAYLTINDSRYKELIEHSGVKI
jgi:hypothetical protein